jgi:hypothetical protein
MRGNVAEQEQWPDQIVKVEALSQRKDSRIKGADAVRFIPNKIRKSVGSGRVDEAVANPLASFHAVVIIQRKENTFGAKTYPSVISAITSNASSTPSSVISAPSAKALL